MLRNQNGSELWRLIVVGGLSPNIGRAQLVCDIIQAFPKVNWIAGRFAEAAGDPCALTWETQTNSGTAASLFLAAGASRSFELRANRDSLADCLRVLRRTLSDSLSAAADSRKMAVVIESDLQMQFLKPSLYFAVIDPDNEDFSEASQVALESANALVLRATAPVDPNQPPAPLWMKVPPKLLQQRPSVLQTQGELLARPLESLIHQMLDDPPSVEFSS